MDTPNIQTNRGHTKFTNHFQKMHQAYKIPIFNTVFQGRFFGALYISNSLFVYARVAYFGP